MPDGDAGHVMTTVYIGQFTDTHADELAQAFDAADIGWNAKTSGAFVRVIFAADWGVRLFVEEDDLDRAREIARRIAPDGLAGRG